MHRTRTPLVAAALVALATALTACGIPADGSDPADSTPVAGTEVKVVDNAFEPEHLEIGAGDTVTWEWDGNASHDVAGDDFESEVMDSGTFSHTFDDAGSYDYRCTLHPDMTGTVTVVDG